MERFPVRVSVGFGALLLVVASAICFAPQAMGGCGDTSVTCLAGRIDNFSTLDGSEPTAASPALQAAMVACGPTISQFDVEPVDQCLGHTFTGCWPVSCAAGATLTFHAKGGSGTPETDDFLLGGDGTPLYSISFNALRSWQTGGADLTWDTNDEATFVVQLGNLPPGGTGSTDLRPSLQDGDLDILFQDDTLIDYLQLYVRVNATPTEVATWGQVKSTYR